MVELRKFSQLSFLVTGWKSQGFEYYYMRRVLYLIEGLEIFTKWYAR